MVLIYKFTKNQYLSIFFIFAGLSMLLFVNQSDYLLSSHKAGLLVTIHSANDTVIPNIMGVSIPAGYSVAIGVRRLSFERMGIPYGDCIEGKNPEGYLYSGTYSPEVSEHLFTRALS